MTLMIFIVLFVAAQSSLIKMFFVLLIIIIVHFAFMWFIHAIVLQQISLFGRMEESRTRIMPRGTGLSHTAEGNANSLLSVYSRPQAVTMAPMKPGILQSSLYK